MVLIGVEGKTAAVTEAIVRRMAQIRAVEERINRRPRTVLGYRIPEELLTAVAPP